MSRTLVARICNKCGKAFKALLGEVNRGGGIYCSPLCRNVVSGVRGRAAFIANKRATALERFWERVARKGPNDCWEWTGKRHRCGYCYVHWNGKYMLAHRISLSLLDNDWDNPLDVLHRCDNPVCCNPAHLWRGTAKENWDDMVSKGRQRTLKGADNAAAKLTETNVIAIRVSKKRTADIAAEYDVSWTTIREIRRRDTWRHIP